MPKKELTIRVETEEHEKMESKRKRRSLDLDEKLRIIEEAAKIETIIGWRTNLSDQNRLSFEY
jgi:hypothetical protein